MTIDTSPEALPELRMYAGGYSAPDVINALIDALEEARREAGQWKLGMIGVVDELEEARSEISERRSWTR